MRKLIYEGYILTNSEGLTDTWKLIIGEQTRVGSLFELRRQINFFQELGVLPPIKGPLPTQEPKTKLSNKRLHKAKPKLPLRP
ncbi:Protein of unknown function (DUF3319) [Shewanella psychrophila]|uniref:DUF3319 domain-containing protein n=1 Tax=Shewanella psychrophila TaxID=225848 RepID=A0A1S6HUI6_9GAMM|nr:hypothetical protein [Shewanella psychrophila]AQS39220.1 Protein of unknown function (DUF3319) [Shewanella psychrophila]